MRQSQRTIVTSILLVVLACLAAGCRPEQPPQAAQSVAQEHLSPQERFGLEIVRLAVTGHGTLLDLRYKVLHPDKAAPLLKRGTRAYVTDEDSGREITIAKAFKLGELRQYTLEPVKGRTYFILFGNPDRALKPGSKVTLCIGEFRVEHLVVE